MRLQNSLRETILELIKSVHKGLRGLKVVGNSSVQENLLDVGGGCGIDGEFLRLHSSFAEVVIVNLHEQIYSWTSPSVRSIMADGRTLPFATHSFDWVFSNAIIEHVGDTLNQRRFADEIRRVAARGYFVATPNRFFPIEPHTLLPFYQFLPSAVQRRVVRLSPGYVREPARNKFIVEQRNAVSPSGSAGSKDWFSRVTQQLGGNVQIELETQPLCLRVNIGRKMS
jgi:ubiquinone/menaquinone biosynthesis C-methylase UbiE